MTPLTRAPCLGIVLSHSVDILEIITLLSVRGLFNGKADRFMGMAMRDRVIRDEIHKDIFVPANHAKIIDTREFQRLRSIQQLSTCEYVFPAANHNRFSHSLGVIT